MLHIIFQRHHIPPDEFFEKPAGVQAFMLESMKAQLKAEHDRRNKTNETEEGGE